MLIAAVTNDPDVVATIAMQPSVVCGWKDSSTNRPALIYRCSRCAGSQPSFFDTHLQQENTVSNEGEGSRILLCPLLFASCSFAHLFKPLKPLKFEKGNDESILSTLNDSYGDGDGDGGHGSDSGNDDHRGSSNNDDELCQPTMVQPVSSGIHCRGFGTSRQCRGWQSVVLDRRYTHSADHRWTRSTTRDTQYCFVVVARRYYTTTDQQQSREHPQLEH